MNKLLSKTGCFIKKNVATILTGIGTAGVVITAVSAIKATPKALYSIEEAEKEKGDISTYYNYRCFNYSLYIRC